jgi:hypothetical protein
MAEISRATDTIWRTADLEYGDPYEDDDEAGWFRDKKKLMMSQPGNEQDEELMSLIPGWNEAKRAGWKPMIGPKAYRGTGDHFEVIAPKHMSPDEDHWDRIPLRWIRYSQGEGGMQDPYVMHAPTFREAINDRNLRGWNLYKTDYDHDNNEIHRVPNDQYPWYGSGHGSANSFTKDFEDYNGGPGYFDNMRAQAEKRERRLAEGGV